MSSENSAKPPSGSTPIERSASTDSPAAEILHSHEDPQWRLPAVRYTFVAGPVQFFAIDTNLVTRAELDWLDRELGKLFAGAGADRGRRSIERMVQTAMAAMTAMTSANSMRTFSE